MRQATNNTQRAAACIEERTIISSISIDAGTLVASVSSMELRSHASAVWAASIITESHITHRKVTETLSKWNCAGLN